MKSKSQDNKVVTTSCKQCKFAIYEEDTQTGCLLGRIDNFQKCKDAIVTESMDDDKEFYTINRACNYFRVEGTEINAEQVKYQSQMAFGVVISLDQKDDEREAGKTHKSLIKIDYSKTKWGAIICHDKDSWYDNNFKKWCSSFRNSLVKRHGIYSELLMNINEEKMEYDTFRAAHNLGITYVARIGMGQEIEKDAFKRIDAMVNEQMKKVVTFSTAGTDFILFKALNMYYPRYNCYDKLVENLKQESKLQGLHIDL
tara:strand:+ start:610 stop:1377 length:768 start_codon:yes stop_codon:yes gene_type:complete